MKRVLENHIFVRDMLGSLSCIVGQESVTRGVRALCRYFGGQMVYIPAQKTDGLVAERLRGVLADEVGDRDAEKILDKLMMFYGGMQVYIPLERAGFKADIAREVYERYDGTREVMSALCREYNISFSQIYTLCKQGRDAARREWARKQPSLFD